MADQLTPLGTVGVRQFRLLRPAAVKTVTEQIYVAHGGAYDQFGPRGREACHEAGDAVLAGFGDKLRRLTRATDIVTRFGGEEFSC
jgi:predicted signal transduction protein with EAL and GGDEF domain